MRFTSPYFEALWPTGRFIGNDRSHAVVTVEKDWSLHLESSVGAPDATKLPFRWWHRADNAQVETQIPNIQSISWDRSVDSDAASCSISIYNQAMEPNMSGQNRRLGRRGHYTPRRRDINAAARWPETPNNEWTGVLVPNALIRTYEGFGGHDKTTTQALLDGNLFLTGVWLVDEVRFGSDGMLQLQCRDMCKLLLEQQLYVPLMPIGKYPLSYYKWRWEYTQYPAVPYYDRTDPTMNAEVYFGPGAEGRKWTPDLAVDGDGLGYAILGTDGGIFTYETSFYGSRGQGAIQGIVGLAARPQGDGYWAADSAGQVFAFGGAIRYGSPSNLTEPIVRIAATHTGNGYWLLDRAGDVIPFGDAAWVGGSPEGAPSLVDMVGTNSGAGYWLLANNGAVYAYGNAGYHGNATIAGGQTATGLAARPNNDGYWICASDGAVYAKGGATYYGGLNHLALNAPICAIVATSTGLGYWLLGQDGGVFAGFGDAVFHGSSPGSPPIRDMASAGDGGYWLIADSGPITPYGDHPGLGSPVPGVDPTPMRGLAMDPLGRGYWLCAEDGAVYAFGEAGYYGGANAIALNAIVVRIVATPSGRGYWLLAEDGGVFAFGDAVSHGSGVGVVPPGEKVVDMARTPSGGGYWLLTEVGAVYSFGDAIGHYYGNATITPPDLACGIAARPQGDGYWIVSRNGGIFAMGSAQFLAANGDWGAFLSAMNDPITSVESSPSGNGYLLLGGDGGVFSFGDAPYTGSLPGAFATSRRFPGNYEDLSDIIKDLLLWAGWLLYGTGYADVFGNIESTGTYVEDPLPADTFDKKPIIDAINAVRDIVGYEFWIDEEGGARFESPNFYTYGNFVQETGMQTSEIPEINERQTVTSYALTYNDRPIRSEIIITSDDPMAGNASTVTTSRTVTSSLLRGMVRPAMIPTPFNVTAADQAIMAELIEQHMHFQTLQGAVTCVANPAIQINDQVRIYEQVTGETDVHFVRGVSSSHDLDSGQWTYTLTTNRLGSGRSAATTGAIPSVPEPIS